MSSVMGNKIRLSLSGASHAPSVEAIAEGFPEGFEVNFSKLSSFMKRRAPGGRLATPRKEEDIPIFLSGISDNKTDGQPLHVKIENKNVRSGDYKFSDTPRPAHADYTAMIKYDGKADMRGGGHFSARLTAPLCALGGIAKQILEEKGIFIGAHLYSVGETKDESFPILPTKELFENISKKELCVIDDKAMEKIIEEIESARNELDSVGGVIECAVIGLDAGIGGPYFEGIEGEISKNIFAIPAVKGIEFGSGFEGSSLKGSQNNDSFIIVDGEVKTETNNCGGILGGISNGMPIVFKTAFKPTPSIARTQKTVSLSQKKEVELEILGRHDPCVAVRAVAVVEAVTALTILDLII